MVSAGKFGAGKLAHVDLSGLRLQKVDAAVKRAMWKGLEKGADAVRDKAKQLAPRGETGTLKDSIHSGMIGKSRQKRPAIWTYTGEGGGGLAGERKGWYGGRVETGTSRMAAQPFIRPALKAEAGNIAALVKTEIKKVR